MYRKNRFRGKDIVTGEWYFGNLIQKNEKSWIVVEASQRNLFDEETNLYFLEWHEVDTETVAQLAICVNQVEVYFGDIVKVVWPNCLICSIECEERWLISRVDYFNKKLFLTVEYIVSKLKIGGDKHCVTTNFKQIY